MKAAVHHLAEAAGVAGRQALVAVVVDALTDAPVLTRLGRAVVDAAPHTGEHRQHCLTTSGFTVTCYTTTRAWQRIASYVNLINCL